MLAVTANKHSDMLLWAVLMRCCVFLIGIAVFFAGCAPAKPVAPEAVRDPLLVFTDVAHCNTQGPRRQVCYDDFIKLYAGTKTTSELLAELRTAMQADPEVDWIVRPSKIAAVGEPSRPAEIRTTSRRSWVIAVANRGHGVSDTNAISLPRFATRRLRSVTLQPPEVACFLSVFSGLPRMGQRNVATGGTTTAEGRRSATRGRVCKWKRLRMQAPSRVPLRFTRGYIPTPLRGVQTAIRLSFPVKLHQAEELRRRLSEPVRKPPTGVRFRSARVWPSVRWRAGRSAWVRSILARFVALRVGRVSPDNRVSSPSFP